MVTTTNNSTFVLETDEKADQENGETPIQPVAEVQSEEATGPAGKRHNSVQSQAAWCW